MGKINSEYFESNFQYYPGVKPIDLRDKNKIVKDIGIYMLDKLQQMFKIKGLPETIPEYMVKSYLMRIGHTLIIEHKDNLYAVFGGFGGKPNAYYFPTEYIVDNPYLDLHKTYTIGKDAVLIKNDHNMVGLLPLINRYSTLMAENELSMYISVVMSRLMSIIKAGDGKDQKAAKLFLDDIEAGKLGAVLTNNFFQTLETQPYASNVNNIGQLIELEQYLKASAYNEVGLNANYNMKREALSMTESQMNNDALFPLCDDMEECWKEGWDEVNKMFGTNVSVEKNSSWETNEIERETIEETLLNEENNKTNEEVDENETD